MTYAPPRPHQTRHYLEQQIQTASQEQLLILLYEGAIRFLHQAKTAMEKQSYEKCHHCLIRAQKIVMEFMLSLDLEQGGEVAVNLYALYEYLYHQMVQANLHKDVTMVQEVISHLEQLKATWEEAIRIAAREQRQAGESAEPTCEEDEDFHAALSANPAASSRMVSA
ncbi:MAG: flagellar export chaperone FliS [Candidatus Melainabacteria bacterium]|nr:flagellar export chaperone FliS [Candidatus Melainabacteria bacterium]